MIDFEVYKKRFREKALINGYSEDIILKCLKYGETLHAQNLPIIYNSYHLAGLVGYNHKYLTRAIISTEFFYRKFKILKKNGKEREICEPLPSLKEIQYFILKEILYKQKVSKYCKSYIPKKKFREYLKFHSNEKQVLTLDIKDFFPSIKTHLIENYFLRIGYAKDVAKFLTGLCTYSFTTNDLEKSNRILPQGAPTSPYLTNLILTNFDDKVAKYCSSQNIKYTRYADDMAFSGNDVRKDELIDFVKFQLLCIGLELNDEKINFMKQNVPQIISGIIVNKKLQLPKNERNDLRKTMHFLIKFGLEDHMRRTNETRDYYVSHLLGKIQYGLNINPNDLELQRYKLYILENREKFFI